MNKCSLKHSANELICNGFKLGFSDHFFYYSFYICSIYMYEYKYLDNLIYLN